MTYREFVELAPRDDPDRQPGWNRIRELERK